MYVAIISLTLVELAQGFLMYTAAPLTRSIVHRGGDSGLDCFDEEDNAELSDHHPMMHSSILTQS
jgi:hypothetical protein